MQVDDLLRKVGNPGKYHVLILIGIAFNFWPVGFSHVNMTFFGAHVKHRCKTPGDIMVENGGNVSFAQGYKTRIESDRTDGVIFENVTVDSCRVYANFTKTTNKTIKCPLGWHYYKEAGEETIVTQWDLVCDRAYLNSLATTIYFFGVMIGGLVFGPLSDHYGRRPVILTTLIVPTAIGCGLAFVDNYILFLVLRFIQGCFIQGLQITNFILLTELFTPQRRTIVGNLQGFSYDINNMMFALVSYLLKDWRHIQLAYTLPFIPLFFQIWTLPESPRWLLSHNKYDEAERFFKKVAKFNRVEFDDIKFEKPNSLLKEVEATVDDMETKETLIENEKNVKRKRHTVLDLFKTPNLRKRTLILFFISMALQVANYGIMFSVSTLPGNKYFVFFISAVMCSPMSFIGVFLQKRFGRKRPLCVSLILISVFCLLAGFIPERTVNGVNIKWLVTAFALLARCIAQLAFLIAMIITAEMFPTSVRNIGAGGCMTCMRIGVMVSSQLLLLGENTFLQLPYLIFGAFTGVASFLVLLLPEVCNSHLPDTIEEVENADDHVTMCCKATKKDLKIAEIIINEGDEADEYVKKI